MAKKVKKKSLKSKSPSISDAAIDRLIDSNIALQHKMTDVIISVKDLNNNVSSLVTLFKSAGEHIKASKYEDPMVNKINELLEQNKNLSKALMMLEAFVKNKSQAPRPNPLSESQY